MIYWLCFLLKIAEKMQIHRSNDRSEFLMVSSLMAYQIYDITPRSVLSGQSGCFLSAIKSSFFRDCFSARNNDNVNGREHEKRDFRAYYAFLDI